MMWGRAVIVLLGVWLLASPFVFPPPSGAPGPRLEPLVCGALVVGLALLSCWGPANLAIVGVAAVAVWLIAWDYFAFEHPRAGQLENEIFVGWLVVMFTLVPRRPAVPPPAWRRGAGAGGEGTPATTEGGTT